MTPHDYAVDCNNPDCGWTGMASRCVTPKHVPEELLCPECHETVEPVGEAWVEMG